MTLKGFGIFALLFILLIMAVLLIVLAHEQQAFSRQLSAAIAEERAERAELLEQNAALRAQVQELRQQLCRAMDEGRCVEEKPSAENKPASTER